MSFEWDTNATDSALAKLETKGTNRERITQIVQEMASNLDQFALGMMRQTFQSTKDAQAWEWAVNEARECLGDDLTERCITYAEAAGKVGIPSALAHLEWCIEAVAEHGEAGMPSVPIEAQYRVKE